VTSTIHYRVWRQFAFYIYLIAFILTMLTFVPQLGLEHGGATRWLDLGFTTVQPAEFLKIAFIIYMATWLSGVKKHIVSFTRGTLPFIGLLLIPGIPMLLQPDTDTYLIMCAAAVTMFIVAGGRIRDIAIMGICGIIVLTGMAFTHQHVKNRIMVFLHPSLDQQGIGYQIKQSLIAVGSGGYLGRGFGQSIQKFDYLPEPIGDSVFAVYAEEFGFLGSVVLILLFAAFTLRGLRVASHSPDLFSMLLVVGLIMLIALQVWLNIGSMIRLAPLAGLPLPFISHGGTALLMLLASVGIIMNISKYQKPTPV
jgi:cell division protein FtsW